MILEDVLLKYVYIKIAQVVQGTSRKMLFYPVRIIFLSSSKSVCVDGGFFCPCIILYHVDKVTQ